jgi:hypothetical protein
LEPSRLVRAITKGLVGRVPAAAESDGRPSGETVCLTLHVNELDFTFDAQRAITSYSNLG